MKQISLLFLSLLFCLMLKAETIPAASYDGGSGTSGDPYQIATLAQLRLLSETSGDWDKYFILTADIDAVDTKTWNSGSGLSRIGTSGTRFTGVFDGNNYAIDSLFISNSNEGYGMFGYTSDATIKHLGLTNCSMVLGEKGGPLIGYASSSAIVECYATGSIKGGLNVTGGLVGALSSCTMTACYTNCSVTSASSGGNNYGGLVGITWGTSTIQDCFVAGKVYCNGNYGGITGQVESGTATIKNCYVSGKISNTSCVITANNQGTITNCYFDITINSGSGDYATGVSTTDFSNAASFESFDFDSIWKIIVFPDIDTQKRPYLRWQLKHYTVSFQADVNNGTIDGKLSQSVFSGEDASAVTAVANSGYGFKEWQDVNGNTISTDNPLTVTNVTQDSALYAIFFAGLNVTFSTDGNGTISGTATQIIPYGENTTAVTAVPNTGHTFFKWQNAAGDLITNDNPLVISGVTHDSSLIAVFELNTYNIVFSANSNGTVTGETSQTISYGENASAVTAVGNDGYGFKEWQDDKGNTISTSNPLTVVNVAQDSSLTAIFVADLNITFSTDDNGTITGETSQSVSYGLSTTEVTATAITAGYGFVEWQDRNGKKVSTSNPLTVTNVTSDSILKAIFTERYADGIGSNGAPYQIATLEQLKELSENPGDWTRSYILMTNIDATDTKNWNNGAGFSRIGTSGTMFRGVFDGNNYVIDSLYISNSSNGNGMFGNTSGATIKNLGLTNCYMYLNDIGGALIGHAIGSTLIEKCYITGTVTGRGTNRLGGIVGVMSTGTIKSCYTNCIVKTLSGGTNIGGVVGIIMGTSTIEDCFVAGTIGCGSGSGNYGGFTGQIQSSNVTIVNCYFSGSVANANYVITNVKSGTITNCYYDATKNSGTGKYATALTSSEFSDETNFSGWNFESTWTISTFPGFDTVKRPYLHWQFNHYSVTFQADVNNGSIDGVLSQSVFRGENASAVTAIANKGYLFKEWQDKNGNKISTDNPFILKNVTQNSTITAVFEIKHYTVKFAADGNGTISGNTEQTVKYDSSATSVEAISNTGYQFAKWQDENGNEISTDNPFTLKNVTQDYTITAMFEKSSGIKAETLVFDLDVYPNPTTRAINIQLNEETESAVLSVYSITGEQVYSNSSFNGGPVDLSKLNNGMYIVKISTEGKTSLAKLIKE